VRRADVDPFFFDALGVRLMVGGFSPEDFQSTAAISPALVTMAFWRDRFGDAAPATGQILTDEAGRGIRIAGVLPETFLFPQASRAAFTPQVLVPLVRDPTSQGKSLRVLVRLAPDADAVSAAARVNGVVAAQAAARPPRALPPDLDARTRIVREGVDRGGLEPIDNALRSSSRARAWVVFTAVATLVLLACFNVTGLAIARTRGRHRDLAVRRALGARTRDLVRLLALESLAIVTTGTAAGLLLAWWALPLGARLFAGDFMLTLKPAVIDGRVAAFAALLALGGSLVVILLAARSVGRSGLRPQLAEGAGGTRRALKGLSIVSFEIAAAYLVTVVAALVVGSLIRAWSEETGFDVPDAAVLRLSPPPGASAPDIEQLISDVGRIPGVQAAGGIAHVFLQQGFNGSVFDSPPGRTPQEGPAMPFPIESVPVTHGFFPALGLTPRDGRLPTADEFNRGDPLIVVTETVVREYWPEQRAVGQVLMKDGRPFEVVGVVNDLRLLSLDLAAQGGIFWPVAAMPEPRLSNIVMKLARDAAVDVHQVAATVRARCPDCWVRGSLTLQEALAESIRPRRFSAWLFSGFGVAALVIVGTGILGVVAMATTRRVREIGIRMALGASRSGVLAHLMREQLTPIALGLVMGGIAASWASTFLSSYLYRTEPGDPASWGAAAAAILIVACIGAFVPARRASRTDPAQVLRAE
jgi:putative ABC transport system permease protein